MSWGPWQILIVLLVVVLLFGSKKLRNLGGDLGSAIKGFKRSMTEDDKAKEDAGGGARDANSDSSKKSE